MVSVRIVRTSSRETICCPQQFLFFRIGSDFNIVKTTLFVHVGLFWCFRNPTNCRMDHSPPSLRSRINREWSMWTINPAFIASSFIHSPFWTSQVAPSNYRTRHCSHSKPRFPKDAGNLNLEYKHYTMRL